MRNVIKKLPLPIAGLMLALAVTGNLVLSYGSLYRNIFGGVSAIIMLLLIIKILTYPTDVIKSLDNPVIASVFPTFSMGIMILATYMKPFYPSLAFATWIIGVLLHSLLIIYFTKKHLFKLDINMVFPSYFIVYVGIVVGSVTAPAFNVSQIGQYLFWFGFICNLILLPVVIYRVFKVKGLPEPTLPMITIFAAPTSLCLAGYMNSFHEKNMILVGFLVALSLIILFSVLLYLPKLLKLKFYPSYASFTFPLVISAIAIKLTNGFLINSGMQITLFTYLVKFTELISVSIVVYVLFRYINFLFVGEEVRANLVSEAAVG